MIEAPAVRSFFEEACPQLAAALAAGDDSDSDRLLYLEMADTARMMGEAYRTGETDCLAAVFETIEQCLRDGTPETINLVVVGLLEDLQNGNITKVSDFGVWEPYLGPAAERAWRALAKFWAGDPQALTRWAADSGIELT
jgi:hypothetical protein